MKLFSTFLFGLLIATSLGKDSLARHDTTFIANTVKVEVQSSNTEDEKKETEKRHKDLQETNSALVTATIWMTLGTWVLAIFAIIGFVFSWRTFRSTKSQSRQELRAYVHVKLDKVFGVQELNAWMDGRMSNDSGSTMITGEDGPFWAHNPPRASYQISVANYGQTPAKKVAAQVDVVYDAWPFPQRRGVREPPTLNQITQLMEETRIGNTLPPHQGDSFTLIGELESRKWDTTMPKEFRWMGDEPSSAVYIYGHVGYIDIFDSFHVTYFRFAHITDRTDSRFRSEGIPMHPEGNDTT
jgi:hypothetical protein